MYIVLVKDKSTKSLKAIHFKHITSVCLALMAFNSDTGFDATVFQLDPESGIYEQIFPEVIEDDEN